MTERKNCIQLEHEEEEEMDWTINKKECPIIPCNICKTKSSFHPFYVEAEITGCVSNSCEDAEDVAKRLLEFRGYTFVKIDKSGKEPRVYFLCDKEIPHDYDLTYGDLRKGGGCKECSAEKRTRKKLEKRTPEKCDCKEKKLGKNMGGFYLCLHNNFGTIYPEKAEAWHYELNKGVTPYDVTPSSSKKFWFRCFKYGEVYQQTLNHRTTHNSDCPFCRGSKVCFGNSLLGLFPDLCKELDPEYGVKPDEISAISRNDLNWICHRTDTPHKYKMSPRSRTKRKGGCPKCNIRGYEQRVGGHDHFVDECNKVHNYKYTYPEKYINSYTNIDIFCPVISKTGETHGIFSQSPPLA